MAAWVRKQILIIRVLLILGKFHIFSSAMLIIGFMSGSFLGQQMQFVELLPKYKCTDPINVKPYNCAPYPKEELGEKIPGFCDNKDIKWEIDYHNPLSLHNWIQDL